jgi:hypothetical protein
MYGCTVWCLASHGVAPPPAVKWPYWGGSVVDPDHCVTVTDPDPALFVSCILLFEGAFTSVFQR